MEKSEKHQTGIQKSAPTGERVGEVISDLRDLMYRANAQETPDSRKWQKVLDELRDIKREVEK